MLQQMQKFLKAHAVFRLNLQLCCFDHTLLNEPAGSAHGMSEFHPVYRICYDNGRKQIPGTAALLENTVCSDHPGFSALFIHEVGNELSLWDPGDHHLLWSVLRQTLCHPKQLLPCPSMIPVGHTG